MDLFVNIQEINYVNLLKDRKPGVSVPSGLRVRTLRVHRELNKL